MASTSGSPSVSTFLRWAALMVVAASIAFVVDYGKLGKSATIAEVISDYGTALVPPAFAQVTGAAILVAFGAFLVGALARHGLRKPIYGDLTVALAICSVLAAGWVVAFRHREIELSVALAAVSTVLSGVMFVRAATAASSEASGWLRVPFGLHFGAMTVALPVSLAQWLNASGVLAATVVAPRDEASAVLAVGAAAGGCVALRHGDAVHPAVIALCEGAISFAQRETEPAFATTALTVGVTRLVVAGLGVVARTRRRVRAAATAASRRGVESVGDSTEEDWYLTGPTTSIMRH